MLALEYRKVLVYLLQLAIPCVWHSSALDVEKEKVMSSSAWELLCWGAFTYKHLRWIHFTGGVPVHKYVIFMMLGLKDTVSCVTGRSPCKLLVFSAVAVLFLSDICI